MPKAVLEAPPTPKPVAHLTRQELIDEGGKIDLQIRQFKPTQDRFKLIKERLQQDFEAQPAEESGSSDGSAWQVQYSAREFKRTVDEPKAWKLLKKALGIEKLLTALKPPLSLIDQQFTAEEQKSFVEKERTGGRDLTFVLRAK